MTITELPIKGLLLIENKAFQDERGFFTERFRTDIPFFAKIQKTFVQENFSYSEPRVLRGLHYQYNSPQGKLITCTRGAIFDVAVDIREGSPTYGKHVSVTLSGKKPSWYWVPAGFAHGFCVLGDEPADVVYKVDHFYNSKGEGGIAWNDADLDIKWPVQNPLLSAKDKVLPSFADYKLEPAFELDSEGTPRVAQKKIPFGDARDLSFT